MTTKFSIVCPIKDEVDLMQSSLPSFYSVNPDEVILCVDDPPEEKVIEAIGVIAKYHHCGSKTRILKVLRNPSYNYHQAWVRRCGFRAARNDVILTSDIDLVLNKNVLKTVEKVGKDNVGLCSCSKGYGGHRLFNILGYNVFLRLHRTGTFTGLYAFYRPFWEETEDVKDAMELKTLKKSNLGTVASGKPRRYLGEDTLLLVSMQKKYRTLFVKDVGCVCLTPFSYDIPRLQFEMGRFARASRVTMKSLLLTTFLFGRPHYMRGYLWETLREVD